MTDPDSTGTAVLVSAADEQDDVDVDLERWSSFLLRVLEAAGVKDTEVSLRFVDELTIAELKADHLGGDGSSTDVLSFPIDAWDEVALGQPHLLGDVVVCPVVAARQAPEHAGTLDDELALLLVHSVLHLLGMDHAADDERVAMQRREKELLAATYGSLSRDAWAS